MHFSLAAALLVVPVAPVPLPALRVLQVLDLHRLVGHSPLLQLGSVCDQVIK